MITGKGVCFPMERVLVVGCPGAGKSTFARALRDLTGLPLHYLDQIWHKPDGSNVSREEFDAQLAEILGQERWIVDGNYQRTLPSRLERCDTVFLLDYPLPVCLEGAASRIGLPREDLPWVEQTFDPEFRQWIEEFPQTQLPQIYELLAQRRAGISVVVFHTRQEADAWLAQWSPRADPPPPI